MTIEELNALYEATNFGNLGNYKAPTTISNTNLTAPVVESIPAIQPYILPPIINQGGNNDGGITSLKATDYGYDSVFDNTNITPKDQLQTNFEYDIEEGTIPQEDIDNNKTSGVGIQGLIDLYQKFSPMANIMKLGKTGIETAQKYFADKKETERLEALAQIEQARKQKEAQATIAAAKEQAAREAATATRAMAANPNVYRNAGITSGGFASQNTGTNQGFSNKSGRGRTGYGKGGIVTL